MAEKAQNYVVLDAYHSAHTSFKKLMELMLLNEGVKKEEVLKEIVKNIKKQNIKPRASTDSLDIVSPSRTREPVRIYIDGAFDLIHSGHYNAIR